MSNADFIIPILQATGTDAIDAGVDAQPPVQAARDMLTAVDQDAHAWTEKLATCQATLERAREHTRDLRAQREPLLVAARIDLEPDAIAQLAPLTSALTAALVEEDDAEATRRLVQEKATALEADRADAARRLLAARREALEALVAEQAITTDAQLVAAADAAAHLVALTTLSGTLAMQLGVPYERHPRRRVEMAVAFAFQRIFRASGPAAPLDGGLRRTPHQDAWAAEQARQALEPEPPPEAPVAVTSDDGWTRRG